MEIISSQEELKRDISQWTILDSQLKIVHEKTKKLRERKQELTERICNFIKNNNINNKIKIKEGDKNAILSIYEKREYSSLTYTFIEECLKKIIKNEDEVEYIIEFLKSNREITNTYDIRKQFS
jgi:Family of unknown function (DUF5760)